MEALYKIAALVIAAAATAFTVAFWYAFLKEPLPQSAPVPTKKQMLLFVALVVGPPALAVIAWKVFASL